MCPTLATLHPFEVWDLDSGNLVDNFADEAAAVGWLRDVLADDGPEYVRGLALIRSTPEGRQLIADEDNLVRHVAPTKELPRQPAQSQRTLKERRRKRGWRQARFFYAARSEVASVRLTHGPIDTILEPVPGIRVSLTKHGHIAELRVELPGIKATRQALAGKWVQKRPKRLRKEVGSKR